MKKRYIIFAVLFLALVIPFAAAAENDTNTTVNDTNITYPTCLSDENCLEGEFCNLTSSLCEILEITPECINDSNCADGEFCNNESICEIIVEEPECVIDEDCLEGEVCTEGVCETEEEPENETDDTEVMNTNLGSRMRLIQLEKSIQRNLLYGEAVIEVIEENHPEEDITRLNEIIEELQDLIDEIENTDFDKNTSELTSEFVSIKKSAIDLSSEFKQSVNQLLTSSDKKEIREIIKSEKEPLMAQIKNKVNEAKQEFNAERLRKVFNKYEYENEGLIQQVQNGDSSFSEAKKEAKEELKEHKSTENENKPDNLGNSNSNKGGKK